MSKYNTYEIVAEVRRAVNDYSEAKVQATDTSGSFSNEIIIKHINDAQKFLFDIVFTRKSELFLTSSNLTGVASVYTLPADFLRLFRFQTADNYKIGPVNVHQLHITGDGGSKYSYYRKGNTLVLDKDGITDVCKLWYFARPRLLTMGKVQTGGALSMTLSTAARLEADYYNGMEIEDITGDKLGTISDYTAARVATIDFTAGTADYYGIVPEIPEPFHGLIGRRAGMIMKNYPQSPIKATKLEADMFTQDLAETVRSFMGDDDRSIEDVILQLEDFP